MDEFSEMFKETGSFSIQNLYCRFWTIEQGFLSMKLKKCNIIFWKWGEGVKDSFELSKKMIQSWSRSVRLFKRHMSLSTSKKLSSFLEELRRSYSPFLSESTSFSFKQAKNLCPFFHYEKLYYCLVWGLHPFLIHFPECSLLWLEFLLLIA